MDDRLFVVTGATGRQGGAVTRCLLERGLRVRALTRDPSSTRARELAAVGAEVVGGDLAAPESLRRAFAGAHGVFSVQNPMIDGFESEVAQGRNVGDAAAEVGVRHLVYASAGPGARGTGVQHFETKAVVAEHLRSLGVPLTVLRPMAFMELMSDKGYYPPVSAWHLMPKLAGDDTPLPWICVDDVGRVAAEVLTHPEEHAGADIPLAADVRSLAECGDAWERVTGRRPRGLPMPQWVFRRVAEPDLLRMWEWLRTAQLETDPGSTRALVPDALTVEAWVARGRHTPRR